MKKVSLRFETILRLVEFLDVVVIAKYQIDRIRNIIIAEISNADIEMAEKFYRAKVIRMHVV